MEKSHPSKSQHGYSEAKSPEDLLAIETMARVIIPEVYGGYVPLYHCQFYIKTFQTVEALEDQLRQGFQYFLLQSEGQNQGYFALHFQKEKVLLSKLYLLASARGKGLGQYGLDLSINLAKEKGFQRIDLIVNRQNEGSIAFYQRNGFTITEALEHDFGNGTLVFDYRMVKIL